MGRTSSSDDLTRELLAPLSTRSLITHESQLTLRSRLLSSMLCLPPTCEVGTDSQYTSRRVAVPSRKSLMARHLLLLSSLESNRKWIRLSLDVHGWHSTGSVGFVCSQDTLTRQPSRSQGHHSSPELSIQCNSSHGMAAVSPIKCRCSQRFVLV